MSATGTPIPPPTGTQANAVPYLAPQAPQSTDTTGTDALKQALTAMETDRFQAAHPVPAMRGAQDTPTPPVSPSPDSSGQGGILNTVGKDAVGLGVGAVRAVPQAVGGLMDLGADAGRFIGHSLLPVVRRYPTVARAIVNANNAWNGSDLGKAYNWVAGSQDGHTDFSDRLSLQSSLGQVGNPTWNQGSSSTLAVAAAFASGYGELNAAGMLGAGGKAIEGLSPAAQFAAKLVAHSAGFGLASGAILHPDQERLSNALQALGVHTEFTDWLASHNQPDQDVTDGFEDRFKTALENTAIGIPSDLLFQTGKYWVKSLLGDTRAANVLKDRIKGTIAAQAAKTTGDPTFNPEAPPSQTVGDATPEDAAAQHLDDAFAGTRSQDILNGLRGDIANAAPVPDASPTQEAVPAPTPEAPLPANPSNPKMGISRAIRGGTIEDQRTVPATGASPDIAGEGTQLAPTPADAIDPATGQYAGDKTPPRANPSTGVRKGASGAAIPQRAPSEPTTGLDLSARRSRAGIAKDANTALAQAGAPETVDAASMQISPDGRIVVSADAKAAADAAGLGRPFVSASDEPMPADTIIHAAAKPFRISAGGIAAEHQAEVSSLEAEGAARASQKIPSAPPADNPVAVAPKDEPASGDIQISSFDKGLNNIASMLKDTSGNLRMRIFGATPREDVQAFVNDANAWKKATRASTNGREADITWDTSPKIAQKVGEWRIGNLGSSEDIPGLLRSFADRIGQTARPKSDTELMAHAVTAANEIGEDPTAILAAAQAVAGRLGSVDNAMATLRTLWARGGQDLDGDLGKNFGDAAATSDGDLESIQHKIYNMISMSRFVQEAKAGLGRGLRVNQLPDADSYIQSFKAADPDGELAPREPRSFGPLPRTRQEVQDWMDLWGMTKNNPNARAKFLEGQLTAPGPWKYLRTSVANFFTAAILSAPRTFAIELASPAIMSVVRTLEKTSGAAVISMNPWATVPVRQAARVVAAQVPSAYLHALGDVADVWGQVKNAIETNQSQIAPRSFGGDLNYSLGPLTPNLLRSAGQTPGPLYSLGNLINVFPKAFSRLHGGVREMTERLSYLGEMRAQAQVEAGQKGLTGQDFTAYVTQKLQNSFDQTGKATDEAMLRNAQRSSLTGPVGEDGTKVRQVSNFISQLRSDLPEFRYLMPVFNIEANLLGETLRRLPIAFIPGTRGAFAETTAELAGQRGPILQAEAHGRFMLGASFLTASAMLMRSGLITGAGPQGGADRKVWLATHQPYSIRVAGQWFRYDKLPILGGLLAIPATINDASTYHPGSQDAEDMTLSGAGALAQWFKDRAALRDAAGLLNVGADPTDSVGNFATKFVGNTVSGFVPAALQTTVTNTMDPYLRLKRSWSDYVKGAIPGLSQGLEPVRSVTGEPVLRPYHGLPSTISPIAIAPQTSYKDDPVADELDRLYQTTGFAAGADPKSLSYGNFDPRQVPLEDGHSLYEHAMAARQDTQINGKTLRETLTDLFNSPRYAQAVDADSGEPRTSMGDESRGFLTKQVFFNYENAIKSQLANSSPIALNYLTAAAAKQKDDAYLRNYSADQLVKNPALYKAAGINAEAYANKIKGGGMLLQALQRGTGQ